MRGVHGGAGSEIVGHRGQLTQARQAGRQVGMWAGENDVRAPLGVSPEKAV